MHFIFGNGLDSFLFLLSSSIHPSSSLPLFLHCFRPDRNIDMPMPSMLSCSAPSAIECRAQVFSRRPQRNVSRQDVLCLPRRYHRVRRPAPAVLDRDRAFWDGAWNATSRLGPGPASGGSSWMTEFQRFLRNPPQADRKWPKGGWVGNFEKCVHPAQPGPGGVDCYW